MTDVETEKENSTQKYFFHKIYDKYLNLNQIMRETTGEETSVTYLYFLEFGL